MSVVRTIYFRPLVVAISSIGVKYNENTLESDSHADTFVIGGGTLEILDHEQPVNVQGYDAALGVKQYRTISGALAFIHPCTLKRYHVVVHQAVYIPDLPHHLLFPMQFQAHGVRVNDCPRMYEDAPDAKSHSIVADSVLDMYE